jgi:transcriptional regulator with XRE-family HTH domain
MKRLKGWLDDSDLIQEEFAKSLGVSQATVSDWVNGVTTPTIDKLPDISKKTGLSLEELLDDCSRSIRQRKDRNAAA